MYAARLKRPTPFVDKTLYTSWNALCISAYLDAARTLDLLDARHFALRSLDRILAEVWDTEAGLQHVVAYSEHYAQRRVTPGYLDDYAYTAIACVDAYEATADLSYFRAACRIAEQMIRRFYDHANGGFFDSEPGKASLGVLGTPRKAFQDSPTPAGNPMAAIALLRLHTYTAQAEFRDKAQTTLELLGGVAGQYGIFAASYGLAAALFRVPHEQVVVIGEDAVADELLRRALRGQRAGRSILKLTFNEVTEPNLPTTLATTLPHLRAVKEGKSCAVVCAHASCYPPAYSTEDLDERLSSSTSTA
jgi:uncharacterized protein YyaL (SSP411 family)